MSDMYDQWNYNDAVLPWVLKREQMRLIDGTKRQANKKVDNKDNNFTECRE